MQSVLIINLLTFFFLYSIIDLMNIEYKTAAPLPDSTLIIPYNVKKALNRGKYKIIFITGGAGYGKTSLMSLLYARSDQDKDIWYNIDAGDMETDRFLSNIFFILKSKFNVRKKSNEEYFDYIIRVLNEKFMEGTIYFDNVHSLGASSEIKLYRIIKSTPDVKYVISKRPSQVSGVKEVLYNPHSILLTEKELNFTIEDIKRILKIMKMPIKYAKLIYWQSRGYPFASKLMMFSSKGKKENRFLAGEKMELLFDSLLAQFEEKKKRLIILSSLLPDSVFPLLVPKIKEFPSIEELREKGVPIVVLRNEFQYHITFNNYLKRKSIETDKDKQYDFFRELLKVTRNQNIRNVLNYMLRDFESLESDVSNMEFSKLHKSVFGGLYLIDSGTLDKNIAMEKIENFPHLYLFFSFMFAQEVNEIEFTLESKRKIIDNLIDNIERFNDDWKEIAYTMIVGLAVEINDVETVIKYGKYLITAKYNRGIAAVAIGSYAQILAGIGEIKKAEELWKIAKEWGEKYNWVFAVLNAVMGNIEYLINVAEDYDGAFPLIMEGIYYARKRDIINAEFYLYKQIAEYYLVKRDYGRVKSYVNQAMEIANYLNINGWKQILYLILFKMYDDMKNIKSMNDILHLMSDLDKSGVQNNVNIINYLNARIFFRKGNYSESLKFIDKIIESKNFYPLNEDEVILTKVNALIKIGKTEEAIKDLKHLIEKNKSIGKIKSVIKYYGMLYKVDKDKDCLETIYNLIKANNLFENDNFIRDNVNLLFAIYNENIYASEIEKKLRKINKFNRIILLGDAKIFFAGKERKFTEKKLVELLTILAVNYKRMVSREQLVEWIYPTYELNGGLKKAKDNLRKTVSRLNKLLKGRYIRSEGNKDGGYILDFEDDYTVDLIEFLNISEKRINNDDIGQLIEAFNLYSGELLNNFQYVVDKVQEYRNEINDQFISVCKELKKHKNINEFNIYKVDIEKKLKDITE